VNEWMNEGRTNAKACPDDNRGSSSRASSRNKINQSFSEGVHWTTIQLLNQAAFLL